MSKIILSVTVSLNGRIKKNKFLCSDIWIKVNSINGQTYFPEKGV